MNSHEPGPEQTTLENYFAQWRAFFEQAYGHPQVGSEQVFQIAGSQVRLRFAGEALKSILTPALSHLPAGEPGRKPDLEVLCWDGAATDVRPPETPWTWPDQWRQGATLYPFGNKSFQVSVQPDTNNFSVFRADTGQAIFWVRDARALAPHHHSAPLLVLFAAWAASRNLMLVHAGCVGTGRGAVLLVGKGGSGKSTTSLLCAEAGLDYLSDDYCLVGTTPVPTAYSLFNSGKLYRKMLPSFPRLAAFAVDTSTDPLVKPVIFLHQDHGHPVISERPLRAIVVPLVTGRAETTFEPTSVAQALLALAPSTLFQLPNAGAGSFQSLAQLTRNVPCFRLNLGTNFADIPPAIRALLDQLP